ncbi:hypothetical protein AB0D38_00580 [Streptomyces sp. NPDC048279]|uniref:hypothetical protein n=1 Tax=Streptomyces sp. NPDC048279 TaxID=3154714 RepID=UPI0034292F5B
MIECLDLSGNEHVLEIGTGLGFQTALLARLAADVVTAWAAPWAVEPTAGGLCRLFGAVWSRRRYGVGSGAEGPPAESERPVVP